MEDIAPFFGLLLGNAPLFIAAIVGIALSAVLWSTAKKSAALVLIACLIQVVVTLANASIYGFYLPHATQQGGYASVRVLLMAWGGVGSLLHAIAFGLLFWGVFAGRQKAAAPVI
jgi:hypothetical protein